MAQGAFPPLTLSYLRRGGGVQARGHSTSPSPPNLPFEFAKTSASTKSFVGTLSQNGLSQNGYGLSLALSSLLLYTVCKASGEQVKLAPTA